MKRNNRLWNVICLITALSVFFVVMTEAHPSRFSKPLIRRKNVHLFTEVKHVPDLAFFWNMSRRVSRYNQDLSDKQKARMKEEFWKLFIHAVAVQQEALNKDPGAPEKEDSALQRTTFISAQHPGQIFAGYLRAIDDILRSEQHNRSHRRKAGAKKFGRLQVATDLWTPALTSSMLAETKFIRSHSYAAEETTDITQQLAWATLAQVSLQTPLHHDLSQLQTFRL